jgi:hypothetical protein
MLEILLVINKTPKCWIKTKTSILCNDNNTCLSSQKSNRGQYYQLQTFSRELRSLITLPIKITNYSIIYKIRTLKNDNVGPRSYRSKIFQVLILSAIFNLKCHKDSLLVMWGPWSALSTPLEESPPPRKDFF